MPAIVTAAVALVLLLLPVQCLVLPMNMSLVDLAGLVTLPICWVWLLQVRRPLRLPFLPGIWLILLVAALSSLMSLDPADSISVLIKETYLYVWLITLAAAFEHLDPRALRRLLLTWCAVAFAHGALIVAQFVYPPLLAAMSADIAGLGSLDLYRPSGLMENCNAAAVFQLTAFVPLLALAPSRGRAILFGSLLLLTMLATGSMATALAFVCAACVAMGWLVATSGDWRPVLRFVLAVALGSALLALIVFALAQEMPGLDARLHYVLTGRSEYSAEGRYAIWSRALALVQSDLPVFGIGPDMFKRIDGHEVHNDLLSFAVERGPLGALALLGFAFLVGQRTFQVVRGLSRRGELHGVVFLAALAGLLVVAQTHEIFHQRPLWLVLALQEAMWWRARRTRGTASAPRRGDHAAHAVDDVLHVGVAHAREQRQ